mgnify:CR=1 FL=1
MTSAPTSSSNRGACQPPKNISDHSPALATSGTYGCTIAGAWRNSSAFEMAQRGKHAQVPDCIRRWCKSRKSLQGPLEWTKGLAIRREIEARLYATPDDAPFDPLAIRKEMEALWRDR